MDFSPGSGPGRPSPERVRRGRATPGHAPGQRPLPRPAGPLLAFVSDLDRTLLRPGTSVFGPARRVLASARALGLRTLIVSGRETDDLRSLVRRLGPVDALVAENGAVVEAPVGSRPAVFGRRTAAQVRRRLGSGGAYPVRYGTVIASAPRQNARRLARALRGLPVRLVPNVDRIMVLPCRVSKGTGTRAALRRLGLPTGAYAAIGDAENDRELLRGAALSAAVRNAEPAIRALADYRCTRAYARGALEFVLGPLADRIRYSPGGGDGPPGDRLSGGQRAPARAPR